MKNNGKLYIYTLSCPKTKEIRYIGKTNSIKNRLQSHICYAKNIKRKRRYVCNWIVSLLNQDLKPIISIIEEVNVNNWVKREKYWIKHFKSLGFNLCNLTDGGESNDGYVYSEALKEVRRNAKLGNKIPKLVRDKISKTLSKQIICIEDNIIFNSIKEAIASTDIPKTTFHRKLHKKEKINNKSYKFYNN